MTIEHDRAIARKMSKTRMFDIANSVAKAGGAVADSMIRQSDGDYHIPDDALEWLKEACQEWENYIADTKKDLGIC